MYYKVCPYCGEVAHAYANKKEWICSKCFKDLTAEEVSVMRKL